MDYLKKHAQLADKFLQKLAEQFEYDSLSDESLAKESEQMLERYLETKLLSKPRFDAVIAYKRSHPVDPTVNRRTGPMEEKKPT